MPRSDRSLNLRPASVRDYREAARRVLPRQLFDYIDGGAYEETTMRSNMEDLASIHLRQRVLRDVSHCDTRTTILGEELAMPVALAPVGLAGMFAARAEVQAARAAEKRGIRFCESTVSIAGIEEVAAATSRPFWFQLYVMRDRSYAEALMKRAQTAGATVLMLTVDLPVVGARYRDTRNGMTTALTPLQSVRRAVDLVSHPRWVRNVGIGGKPHTFGNLEDAVPGARTPEAFKEWVDAQFDPSVTWDDLAWVRANWSGKIVLKGILDPADASRAVDAGVDGIVVSNHGGRQLDDTPSTIHALRRVAAVVGDSTTVLMDGGIRSGLDVVKAICSGANGVLIGRAWAYAVAAHGEAGVKRILSVIRQEMLVAMALLGVNSVEELNAELIDSGDD